MRIYLSTIWLFSASLLSSSAVGSNITFNPDDFKGLEVYNSYGDKLTYQTTIFTADQLGQGGDRMFTWTPSKNDKGPTIKSVVLAAQNQTRQIASGDSASPAARILISRSDPSQQDAQSFPVDYLGGSLTLTKSFIDSVLAAHHREPLFFQLEWTNAGGETGYSYSEVWAVVHNEADAPLLLHENSALNATGTPAYPDMPTPMATAAATSATPAPSRASDSSTSATASKSTASKSTASSGPSKGSSGGGLSTGAIVGIVIGCVAVLVLISVVAGCFCLRRRRRNGVRRSEEGGRGVHAPHGAVAEKESRIGILERDDSGTLTYSEDSSHRAAQQQQQQQHPLGRGLIAEDMSGSGVGMGVGQPAKAVPMPMEGDAPPEGHHAGGNGRDAIGYSSLLGEQQGGGSAGVDVDGSPTPRTRPSSPTTHERTSMMTGSLARGGGGGGGAEEQRRQHHQKHDSVVSAAESGTPRMQTARFGTRSATPSGVSGRYAHLVEDGMTDDDIRRLEEEERALDEAIEEAGRDR